MLKWVWVKIKPPENHRFWFMLPLTRVPFWVPVFDPQPNRKCSLRYNLNVSTELGVSTCWAGREGSKCPPAICDGPKVKRPTCLLDAAWDGAGWSWVLGGCLRVSVLYGGRGPFQLGMNCSANCQGGLLIMACRLPGPLPLHSQEPVSHVLKAQVDEG